MNLNVPAITSTETLHCPVFFKYTIALSVKDRELKISHELRMKAP